MNPELQSLCFLVEGNMTLLAKKGRGLMKGWRTGFGGKREPQDALYTDCTIREGQEELGFTPIALYIDCFAFLDVYRLKGSIEEHLRRVAVQICTQWNGIPRASAEMLDPRWFPKDDLPLAEIHPSNHEWIGRVLRRERLHIKKVVDGERTLSVDIVPAS
ncbi:NUDIX domain-containing protein [Candidatus Parcubacteria bacterium]|nr:NUDIX domain-containing protein [Candidatus Parcubacteria bacterium]